MKAKLLVYALPALVLTIIHLAQAQQPEKVPRLGYLSNTDPATESTPMCIYGLFSSVKLEYVSLRSTPGTYIEDGRVQMANRTTHRGKAGKKLYAVRDKSSRVTDIQTYKRGHGQVHSKEIDEILSRIKEKYGLAAVIVGMASGSGKIATHALGNSMTGVKATPNMHWRIGAVTHTMYATLLLRYVDQHIVRLADKLRKWFPKLKGSDRVTLRMLSNNTSSYDDYVYLPQFQDVYLDDPFREWTDDELVAIGISGPKTLAYPPGKDFNYSHTNFVILKQVLEKIGGEPIDQLLWKHILQPLRLRDTEYPLNSDIAHPALHAFDIMHDVYQESTYWSPSWTSGPMSSNVCDLVQWSRALGRGTLLSPASRKEMFAPVTVGTNEPSFYYAMGVIVA